MTAFGSIKLTDAMVWALKGAQVVHMADLDRWVAVVTNDTKVQTVKGLKTRGLTDDTGFLTPEGVEAARQLGNDITTYNEPAPVAETVQEKSTAPALTEQQGKSLGSLAELLDTPQVVPNRKDKRKARFGLRGAYSRLIERNRQRRIQKHGTTNYGKAEVA